MKLFSGPIAAFASRIRVPSFQLANLSPAAIEAAIRSVLPRPETLIARRDGKALVYIFGGWMLVAVNLLVATWLLGMVSSERDRLARAMTITPDVNYITFAPGTEDVYRRVAADLRSAFPTLEMSVNQKGLFVRAPNLNDYPAWISALEAISSSNYAVRWNVVDLCIGERCPSKEPTATVSAQVLTPSK
jgi:hypothetical protein